MNKLYFGDNLDVLRGLGNASVDLIYLDPPFNSNANYNVLYGTRHGPSKAQARAFEDTWRWGPEAARALEQAASRHYEVGALLDAFQKVFSGSNMMAYLSMMAVRLIEMKRVMKDTGSLYLHCDPTASHYLKLVLDALFGLRSYRSEIVWKRSTSHGNVSRNFGALYDCILFYTKTSAYVWNQGYHGLNQEYIDSKFTNLDIDGRKWQSVSLRNPSLRPNLKYSYVASDGRTYQPHPNGWAVGRERMERYDLEDRLHFPAKQGGQLRVKQYLDERAGTKLQDIWTDISALNSQAQERLSYPTQKPQALLERIIEVSSNPGDVVLDPFCGCGTAVEAAENLKRNWIGIDVTYLAIHVIENRLRQSFGEGIKRSYRLYGRPEDEESASALAARDWLEFQKWAVIHLQGLPRDKPGADAGIDGTIRYHRVGIEQPKLGIVSVKGGLNIGVDAIHKLKSVVEREGAEIGVLVMAGRPTEPMRKEAVSAGLVGPASRRVPRLQIVTIGQMFGSVPVEIPGTIDPPEIGRTTGPSVPAKRRKKAEGQTELLLPITGEPPSKEQRRPNRSIRAVDIEVTRARPSRGAR